jgi:hypothetical protein
MTGLLSDISPRTLFILFAPVALVTYYIFFVPGVEFPPEAPKQIKEQYPVFGALGYFSEKWNFYRRCIGDSPMGSFTFYLGKHAVVGLAGETARETFYNSRELGLTQG